MPAVAIAQALSRKDPEGQVLYIGRRGGLEERVVPRYGIPFATIAAAKVDMEEPWRNWPLPFVLPRAFWEAWRLIRWFRPDVVLGTGGYVSAPVVLVAAGLRYPVVLQEQNYRPGRSTRLLARFARSVAVAYAGSSDYLDSVPTVVTGTPVRSDFQHRKTEYPDQPRRLLVLGGSQGAHRINLAVAEALPQFLARPEVTVAHQTGPRDIGAMEGVKAELAPDARKRYEPFAFAEELAPRLLASDLVLTRAGGSALSEISAVGVPMIIVPGPFAGGHQRLNATPFAEAGAAVIIPDEDCRGARLAAEVGAILDDGDRYRRMVTAISGVGRPQAADDVVGVLQRAVASR